MTPFPYSIDIDSPLMDARELMDEHGIRHIPVREKGELVGVISERDIILGVSMLSEFLNRDDLMVRSAYTPAPYTVDINTNMNDVLTHMAERHIGSVLVLKEDKLVGIFTTTDACKKFAEFLEESFPVGDIDPDIA